MQSLINGCCAAVCLDCSAVVLLDSTSWFADCACFLRLFEGFAIYELLQALSHHYLCHCDCQYDYHFHDHYHYR